MWLATQAGSCAAAWLMPQQESSDVRLFGAGDGQPIAFLPYKEVCDE